MRLRLVAAKPRNAYSPQEAQPVRFLPEQAGVGICKSRSLNSGILQECNRLSRLTMVLPKSTVSA